MATPDVERYEYKGRVYVRPMGRGICLLDDSEEDIYLDDRMGLGYWSVEIRARKLSAEEATAASRQLWRSEETEGCDE